METEHDEHDEREHRFDVFEEGDEIPWSEDYATVVGVETAATVPDEAPDWPTPTITTHPSGGRRTT